MALGTGTVLPLGRLSMLVSNCAQVIGLRGLAAVGVRGDSTIERLARRLAEQMDRLPTVRTLLRLFFKLSLMKRYIGEPGIQAFEGLDSPGPCSAKKSGSSAFAKFCDEKIVIVIDFKQQVGR